MKWSRQGRRLELELDRPPCNEIGSFALEELERFLPEIESAGALVVHSSVKAGFCAGADLRELYTRGRELEQEQRLDAVRDFLTRIHAVLDRLDAAPIPTVAAVHGVVFGGGLELALCCDLIVADATARFAFPELRLGLVPGFGGIPRLRRDVSNSLVRDLLFTGRSLGAARAHAAGLVSQLTAPGRALEGARAAAAQMLKFDAPAVAAAKAFLKPLPRPAGRREIEIFLDLFRRPAVQEALQRFAENETGPLPYLP